MVSDAILVLVAEVFVEGSQQASSAIDRHPFLDSESSRLFGIGPKTDSSAISQSDPRDASMMGFRGQDPFSEERAESQRDDGIKSMVFETAFEAREVGSPAFGETLDWAFEDFRVFGLEAREEFVDAGEGLIEQIGGYGLGLWADDPHVFVVGVSPLVAEFQQMAADRAIKAGPGQFA